ncbi:hypothetical protein [Streptomyces sulphureus]|uniref:hypothetical protein n=1 Tax=Streptomyces sulphureus TaxID=47758 RepID=UPI0003680A33|nr:hypothetical protein [Streptomyces sulphureus]
MDEGARTTPTRQRLIGAAWLCSVVAAALLGAWSYTHATPEGRYERPEPLGDSAVRHELAHTERDRGPSASPTPSDSPALSHSPRLHPHTATVRFAHGVATAVAECRPDGTVRLLSWSPAEGYAVDEAHRGPAATAVLELEPLADDDSEDDELREMTVGVNCEHGKPRPITVSEGEDDDDDDD